MSTKNGNAADILHAFAPLTDEQIRDQFDALVRNATRGDRLAIGAIAIVFGGFLIDEARTALGPRYEQAAGDVVQDFYLGLVEGQFTFPEVHGAAQPWMRRAIRSLAAETAYELGHRGPELDPEGES